MRKYRKSFLLYVLVVLGCHSAPPSREPTGCAAGQCSNGVGVKRDVDGVFFGKFSDGLKEGPGTYIGDSGLHFVGTYNGGRRAGPGTMKIIKADINKQVEGIWDGNTIIGKAQISVMQSKRNVKRTYFGVTV